MANFNKVLLMGNLTRDPQLSYLPSQTPVVEFGIAVNRKWTSKEGDSKEEVCFVDCRAFGRTAENINKYLHKGQPLFVEGRLVYDTWTAQDGSKRSKHRVHVDNFQFIGAPARTAGSAEAGMESQAEPDNSSQAETANQARPKDDIPF
ncbi:MAG: single-stranded DNA-binding protein [Sedimentisphaerales bacterium]|nr:single-stranded DNA-binding protein [Sedimentisphaerales bacterium]